MKKEGNETMTEQEVKRWLLDNTEEWYFPPASQEPVFPHPEFVPAEVKAYFEERKRILERARNLFLTTTD